MPKKYTTDELAAELRSRPGGDAYEDLPNDVLVHRFIERNPNYSDILNDSSGTAETSAPTGLSHRRGGATATTVAPITQPSVFSRVFPKPLAPSERTGTQYQAAPEAPNAPDVRLGEQIPESLTSPLSFVKRYAVDPLNNLAEKAGKSVQRVLRAF